MKKEYRQCEICGKKAEDVKQLRQENWIEIKGNYPYPLSVWLEKPREEKSSYVLSDFMISIGLEPRTYDFCSIECLVKVLKGNKSI
jgi:hypothetical protein